MFYWDPCIIHLILQTNTAKRRNLSYIYSPDSLVQWKSLNIHWFIHLYLLLKLSLDDSKYERLWGKAQHFSRSIDQKLLESSSKNQECWQEPCNQSANQIHVASTVQTKEAKCYYYLLLLNPACLAAHLCLQTLAQHKLQGKYSTGV